MVRLRAAVRRDMEDGNALSSAEHRVFRADLTQLYSLLRHPSGAVPSSGWVCSKLRYLQGSLWNLAMRVRALLHSLWGQFGGTPLPALEWPAPPPLTEDLYLTVLGIVSTHSCVHCVGSSTLSLLGFVAFLPFVGLCQMTLWMHNRFLLTGVCSGLSIVSIGSLEYSISHCGCSTSGSAPLCATRSMVDI